MAVFVHAQRISLRLHPEYNEKWVQDRIAQNPAILGLGELVLRDRERNHPRAGRLDLLLHDPDTKRRYEVELQLGATDEAHIIRSVEYWDIERKRYPQYDHCAVLISEDITSRFLNVISLFNGTIPLIAIQMRAYNLGDHFTLVFTTVLDEMTRGVVDEDEDAAATPTDRTHWEKVGSKATVAMADQLLGTVKEFDPALELKYNKFYIGLAKDGQPNNFVSFRPRKSTLILEAKIKKSEEVEAKIESAGLDALEYSTRWGTYRIRLGREDIKQHADAIKELIQLAFDARNA